MPSVTQPMVPECRCVSDWFRFSKSMRPRPRAIPRPMVMRTSATPSGTATESRAQSGFHSRVTPRLAVKRSDQADVLPDAGHRWPVSPSRYPGRAGLASRQPGNLVDWTIKPAPSLLGAPASFRPAPTSQQRRPTFGAATTAIGRWRSMCFGSSSIMAEVSTFGPRWFPRFGRPSALSAPEGSSLLHQLPS